MKTCPSCQRVYSDMTTVCPKCNVPLPTVAAQPQQQPVYHQPQQQTYQQPVYQQPQQQTYQQPVYQQPQQQTYQQPVYQQPKQQTYQQPVYQQPKQQTYQQPVNQQPQQTPAKKKEKKKGSWVSSLLITLAILFCFGYFKPISKTTSPSGSSPATPPATTPIVQVENPQYQALIREMGIVDIDRLSGTHSSFLCRGGDDFYTKKEVQYQGDTVTSILEETFASKSAYRSETIDTIVNELKTEYAKAISAGFASVQAEKNDANFYRIIIRYDKCDSPQTIKILAEMGIVSSNGANYISYQKTVDGLKSGGYVPKYL